MDRAVEVDLVQAVEAVPDRVICPKTNKNSNTLGSGNSSGSGLPDVSSVSSEASGGSSESGEWEHHEYCFLLKILYQFSFTLDISIRETFVLWINQTQMDIVERPGISEYEALVEIWYSLQILFEANIEIRKKVEFLYIGDWGYVCELEGLSITIQSSTTEITIEESITIGGANSKTRHKNLFKFFRFFSSP